LLAFVGLLPLLSQTVPTLDDLVRACEHIEIGRIESLRPIEGLEELRIATLRVERSIWTADCADEFDFLVLPGSNADQRTIVEGDLAIWFLADTGFRWDEFDSAARRALHSIRWGHPLERLVGHLTIERSDDRDLVVLPWSEPALPGALLVSAKLQTRGTPRQLVPSERFETWLWRAILENTPQIFSRSLDLTIGPDGRGSFSKKETESLVLVPSALRSILATIDRENFYSLPTKVGDSPGPDSNGWDLTARTWRGQHRVLVAGPPNRNSADDVDAYARMLRIRDSLPRSMQGSIRRD
jgi:hypothetical protein